MYLADDGVNVKTHGSCSCFCSGSFNGVPVLHSCASWLFWELILQYEDFSLMVAVKGAGVTEESG